MMKHLIYSMLLLAGLGLAASCSSDNYDEYVNNTSSVKIVKSGLIFNASAGTGTLDYEAPGTVTATVGANWATATVSGNTVTVNVESNPSVEGRTTQLTLKYGNDVATVAIQQTGVSFAYEVGDSVVCGDNATTLTYPIKLAGDLKIWSDESWLTASATSTELNISVTQNTTGSPRGGVLHFSTGLTEDSVYVEQNQPMVDFDEKTLGDYMWVYYNSGWVYTTVTFEKASLHHYQLRFTAGTYATNGVILPVDVDLENFGMYIWNLTDMEGSYTTGGTTYNVMARILMSAGGKTYTSKSTGLVMYSTFATDEEDGSQYWDFTINSSTYEYYGLRLCYTTDGLDGLVGTWISFPYLYLLKM